MPTFSHPVSRELVQLQWGGDEGQTAASWRMWRRMVLLYAASSRGGQLLSGLTVEEAPVAESAAAATFRGIVCNGGRMQAIVEEVHHPNDGYQMFQDIQSYYTQYFKPQERQAATASSTYPPTTALLWTNIMSNSQDA
eukprot:m.4785 g.4785  ORF g.4785 m.4785 type:complete len:138 (-) comp3772_c0_seq1:236-649(-)